MRRYHVVQYASATAARRSHDGDIHKGESLFHPVHRGLRREKDPVSNVDWLYCTDLTELSATSSGRIRVNSNRNQKISRLGNASVLAMSWIRRTELAEG